MIMNHDRTKTVKTRKRPHKNSINGETATEGKTHRALRQDSQETYVGVKPKAGRGGSINFFGQTVARCYCS